MASDTSFSLIHVTEVEYPLYAKHAISEKLEFSPGETTSEYDVIISKILKIILIP